MVPFSNPIWGKSTLPFTAQHLIMTPAAISHISSGKELVIEFIKGWQLRFKNREFNRRIPRIILSLDNLVLFYFPRAAFIWSHPFDYSFCFQLREMLFNRLCSDTDLSSQACSCQRAVFRKKGDDFLPTFACLLTTFLLFSPYFFL